MEAVTEKTFYEKLNGKHISMSQLQSLTVQSLKEKGLRLATAESCTGGLVSQKITEVAGSSQVFDCGICSYANFIKHKVLGVKEETLGKYGAVSPQTAMEMAKGAALLANADIGVATTGIAGPEGGTLQKPVGLVYIGIYTKSRNYAVKTRFDGGGKNSRRRIRELAACFALYQVLEETVKSN